MNHPLSTNWSGGFGNEVYRPRPRAERITEESHELKLSRGNDALTGGSAENKSDGCPTGQTVPGRSMPPNPPSA